MDCNIEQPGMYEMFVVRFAGKTEAQICAILDFDERMLEFDAHYELDEATLVSYQAARVSFLMELEALGVRGHGHVTAFFTYYATRCRYHRDSTGYEDWELMRIADDETLLRKTIFGLKRFDVLLREKLSRDELIWIQSVLLERIGTEARDDEPFSNAFDVSLRLRDRKTLSALYKLALASGNLNFAESVAERLGRNMTKRDRLAVARVRVAEIGKYGSLAFLSPAALAEIKELGLGRELIKEILSRRKTTERAHYKIEELVSLADRLSYSFTRRDLGKILEAMKCGQASNSSKDKLLVLRLMQKRGLRLQASYIEAVRAALKHEADYGTVESLLELAREFGVELTSREWFELNLRHNFSKPENMRSLIQSLAKETKADRQLKLLN